MKEQKTFPENSCIKIKGTSWMIDQNQLRKDGAKKFGKQHKDKWKKNATNKFQGWDEKLLSTISYQLKKQNKQQHKFNYSSLNNPAGLIYQKNWKENIEQNLSHFSKKKNALQNKLFNLERKENEIIYNIQKINRLKMISNICEKKKELYDKGIDLEFSKYDQQIDKTISQLQKISLMDSKEKKIN